MITNPAIQQKLVPNGLSNHPSRPITAIKSITIHTTGNRNVTATAKAHARLQFNGGGGRTASWHYTVDSDEIWQSFLDNQMCWHTGTRIGNETSIGIEICVNSREGFLMACQNTAWLTATLLKHHNLGIESVVQHYNWSGKNCPSELRNSVWGISWDGFLALVKGYFASANRDVATLSPQDTEVIIEALKAANIAFEEDHWRGVFNGNIQPNHEWAGILANRIIDSQWRQFTPKVIGNSFMALLGKNK
ncbi:MAG: N-acetylmuramoyl-L-alanine amidase [Defluviitaleaceae bacterium]|nr:N-acetylmuramoyl-L-alanine amidase [Defluviitaleaceae bacterium]